MPRAYTVTIVGGTYTNAGGDFDIFELTPADDKPIEIVGLEIVTTSEVAEAQEEWIALQIIRGFTSSGSGGSAPTPVPLDPIDTAAGFTAEVMNSTVATTGTTTTPWSSGFNERAGIEKWWPQSFGPQASQANTTIVVRGSSTVADDVTISATLYVLEK